MCPLLFCVCFHGIEEVYGVCKLGVKGDRRKGACVILEFLTWDLCRGVAYIIVSEILWSVSTIHSARFR